MLYTQFSRYERSTLFHGGTKALAYISLNPIAGLDATKTPIECIHGEVLTRDPRVRKLSFTGSTHVGKWLLRESAATINRVTMELGGNFALTTLEYSPFMKLLQQLKQLLPTDSGEQAVGVHDTQVSASESVLHRLALHRVPLVLLLPS